MHVPWKPRPNYVRRRAALPCALMTSWRRYGRSTSKRTATNTVACCVEAGLPQADVDPLVDDLLRGRAVGPVSGVERRRDVRAVGLEPEDATRIVDELFAEFEGGGETH